LVGVDFSGAAMALRLNCPGCDTALNVAETLIGKTIKCKTCGEMIPVTAPAKVAVARRVAAVVDDDVPAKTSRRKWDDGEDDAPVATKSSGGSKGLMIAGIAAALLLLMGGGMAGAYFFFAGESDEVKSVASNSPPDVTTPSRQADAGDPKPPIEEEKKPEVKNAGEPKPTTPEKPAVNKDEQKDSGSPTKTEDKPKPVEPVKPKTDTPATVTSDGGQTSEEYRRKLMSGEMDEITLKQCKHATVFIECEDRFGGSGQGSGWFGLENNIVVTNAHVISMIAPNSPPPAKLTIYVDSGENGQNPGIKQRVIPHQHIKILAVDRTHDIAILEITGEKDLPVPMKTRPTSQLKERQGISIMGFPLGSILAQNVGSRKQPSISVRTSTVSALRYDDFGILRNLQVQAGISSGNSGGPQFDAEGYVIGMTVAVIRLDRAIGLAVPTEHIQGLLAGRIDEVEVDTAYNRDGKVYVPISVTTLDPLKRLKKIGVAAWVGETSGTIRPPGENRKGAVPSDKDYVEMELKYDPVTKTAKGEIPFPALTPGMSYWVQPFYTNAIIPKYYLPGSAVQLKGPPVDLTASNLTVNLRSGPVRPFTLVRTSALDDYAEGEGTDKENRLKFVSTMKGTETVLGPDPADSQSAARLRLKYDDADLKIDVAAEDVRLFSARDMLKFKEGIKSIEAYAYVNRTGGIYKTRTVSLATQDPIVKIFGTAMSADVLGSLTECSIPMPNRDVNPGDTWGATRTIVMTRGFIENLRQNAQGPGAPPGGRPRPGSGQNPNAPGNQEISRREYPFNQEVTFTYRGSRVRGGRKEAVIKVSGKVTPASGKPKDSASGFMKGFAFVDINTGIVIDAEIESEFDLDTSAFGLKQRTYSLNKYTLTRGGSVK
jgi:S1-C subfamily serine protease